MIQIGVKVEISETSEETIRSISCWRYLYQIFNLLNICQYIDVLCLLSTMRSVNILVYHRHWDMESIWAKNR